MPCSIDWTRGSRSASLRCKNWVVWISSRDGKAPGGYNYPLYETGAPFIFMNAVGTTDDVITMSLKAAMR